MLEQQPRSTEAGSPALMHDDKANHPDPNVLVLQNQPGSTALQNLQSLK
jgi:hypothetical protein